MRHGLLARLTGAATITSIDALRLPNREALAFFLQKANVDTRHWADIWEAAHSRSFMVAGAAGDDLLNDFREAIRSAQEDGTTLADFRRSFDDIVARHQWVHTGAPGWRARVIYETNLSTAFSAGRFAQMTEPDTLAVYPYWQYVHSGAAHPRLQHQAWNGLTLLATDDWWKTHHPPNGWGCGCYVRPVSARGMARMGKTVPDSAPEVTWRTWRNPHSGELHPVPNGVDPGFGYNPGEAWHGTAMFPPDAVTRIPPAPPPPVPAPPPAAGPGAATGGGDVPAAPATGPLRTEPARIRTEGVRAEASPAVLRADAALREEFAPWAGSLSEAERDALAAYRGLRGQTMNRLLRGEVAAVEPRLEARIAVLRAALDRSVLPRAIRIFRGAGPAELADYRAGARGAFRSFASGSIDRAIAGDFAARHGGQVVELVLPAGLRGAAYVQIRPSQRPLQYEVLLAPGLGYRVASRTKRRIVIEVFRDGA